MKEVYHIEQPRRVKTFPPAKPGCKYCVTCDQEKTVDSFHKMKGTPDGYRPNCKICRKERTHQPKVIVQQPLFTLSKICSKCGKEKDIEEFNRMKKGINGYHSHCQQCQSDYNHQHRIEHLDDYNARAHIKNIKPKTRARAMEKHRERSVNDPGYLEQRKERRRKHYQTHKEQARDFYPRRRALMLNTQVGKVDYSHILELHGYVCHICSKPIDPDAKKRSSQCLSFDHVIPLKPRPGEPQGTHTEENLLPSHHGCNVRKSNRPMEVLTPYDRRGVE
jgi:HNH endonuclease